MEGNVLVVGVPKGDALRYSDLTAEQIAELKKPATDAAAGVNKVNNEFKQLKASVETAEKGRADAEAVRKKKETERGQNETGRKEAEAGRKTAEQKREQDSAKALADAQAALKDAKTAALNYQSIIDSAAAVTALGLKKVNGKICQMRKVGA